QPIAQPEREPLHPVIAHRVGQPLVGDGVGLLPDDRVGRRPLGGGGGGGGSGVGRGGLQDGGGQQDYDDCTHLLRPSRCSPYALRRRQRVVRLMPRCFAVSASFQLFASSVLTIASFSRAANVVGPSTPGMNMAS